MKDIEVTVEHEQKYKDNPNACPFCESTRINGHGIDTHNVNGNIAYRDISCQEPDCKIEWTERFEITGIGNTFKNDEDDN